MFLGREKGGNRGLWEIRIIPEFLSVLISEAENQQNKIAKTDPGTFQLQSRDQNIGASVEKRKCLNPIESFRLMSKKKERGRKVSQ